MRQRLLVSIDGVDVVTAERVRRGDVFLVDLDPTQGGEIQKTRPCPVSSPDELNACLCTFIVAPVTTQSHPYPFRTPCRFGGRACHIVLDQIRQSIVIASCVGLAGCPRLRWAAPWESSTGCSHPDPLGGAIMKANPKNSINS